MLFLFFQPMPRVRTPMMIKDSMLLIAANSFIYVLPCVLTISVSPAPFLRTYTVMFLKESLLKYHLT